jgi:hypothetical protein
VDEYKEKTNENMSEIRRRYALNSTLNEKIE